MKNLIKLSAFVCFFLTVNSAMLWAQDGKITGKIVDVETGEELIGATVLIQGTSTGTVTDIYGNYQLGVEPGNYALSVSYVGYANKVIEDVSITANEVVTLDIDMSTDVELQEVIVTAEAIKDNDVTLLKIQKKALAVQDGISSREMKQLGVSNAAESMKSVTGASVEDGKFVVMRGLGDRYSITQLNGVTMPSADPYRNSTSMDLIPSDMIDNIITVKTYTPDQPGNFTGGKVDITTKSLPDEFYLNIGLKTSYNTQSSLINNFVTDGTDGKYDWAGFDDGIRARSDEVIQYNDELRGISISSARNPEDVFERQVITETVNAMDNPFVESVQSTPLNYGVDFSTGNRTLLFGRDFGYNLGLSFSSDYNFYDDGRTGIYSDGGGEELIREQDFSEVKGTRNSQLGGLLSLSYQLSSNHELTLSNLYNHDGQNAYRISDGYWRNTARPNFVSRSNSFIERTLNNTQLSGKHFFQKMKGIKLDWILGYVYANQDEPDTRMFGYNTNTLPDGSTAYIMNQSEVGILPSHFYRDLTDKQYNGKIDISIPLSEEGTNEIKFGGSYSNKQREFNEYIYSYISIPKTSSNPAYTTFTEADGDLRSFFSLENSGVVNTPESTGSGIYGFGNFYRNQTQIKNSYTGEEEIISGYLMAVYGLTEKLKLIGGARVESTNLSATSRDDAQKKGNVKTTDILPALNVVYNLNDNANFRAAASQTLARPNMREIAPFSSVGGVGFPIVLGNPDLERTLIQNFDLRYEIYPSPGELFAISAYYKNFNDPIVWQLTPKASTPEIQPINVEKATVYGAEVELRKNLGFITPALDNFKLATNFTYIYSRVDKSQEELDALANADRPNIKDWRPFQGQSPYIVNVALMHNSDALQWENSLSFNIFGERLAFVTGALDPDVYEQPRPSLNFVSTKRFGEHISLGFKAMNLLNMTFEKTFDFPGEFIYESYTIGTTFELSLTYGI